MIVKINTPWEQYDGLWVKREDLSAIPPGPSFSKIRGVEKRLMATQAGPFKKTSIGVVDSRHSKAGWGVSYLCQHYGIPCVVYYPILKSDTGLRAYQKKCQEFGAELRGLPATMSAVLFNQAKKDFYEKDPTGYMMPNGLKLIESVEGTARELADSTPPELLTDDKVWVVSISSGTIGAGVLWGLVQSNFRGRLIFHFGYDRSEKGLWDYLERLLPSSVLSSRGFALEFVNEGYEYKDAVSIHVPFPCNPYYDRKAYKWIIEHLDYNSGNVVFWNIGD